MAAAVDALLGGSSEARRRATSPPLQRSEPCRACSRSCSRPTESANACASGERRSGRCLGHNARRVEEGLGRAPLHEGSRPPCWLRSPLLRRRRWPRRRRAARPPALVLAARGVRGVRGERRRRVSKPACVCVAPVTPCEPGQRAQPSHHAISHTSLGTLLKRTRRDREPRAPQSATPRGCCTWRAGNGDAGTRLAT